MSKRLPVILLTAGLSGLFLVLSFGYILKDPNHTWLTTTGDGMKAYYSAVFHVRYDAENSHSGGMNYPFGELYTYTDAQFPVVSAIRFFSEHILDIRKYTVAVINLLVLLSILAGAVFIGLILSESGVSWWYSSLAAAGIAFLSPQIHRLGGHFSLAWLVWIPMMIWLIMQFDKKRTWWMTLIIGTITWLAGLMHFYYLGFFGFVTGGYWLYRFIRYKATSTYWYRDLLHFSIQYILPVLLLQLYVVVHDGVTDRPGYPFGFQSSFAHPVGIFLPSGTPWAFVPRFLTVFNHISWESFSYVGTVALLGMIAGIVFLMVRVFSRKPLILFSGNKILRVMFWISLAALLFSFGIPFVFGMKEYVEQMGIIRQIRVLARFSWLFYYVLNLVVFAALFRLYQAKDKPWWWKVPALLAIPLLLTEAFYHTRGIAPHLNNRISAESDSGLSGFKTSDFRAADFQAVIPLPWFHIGSENLWVDGTDDCKKETFFFSLQTGIPTTGAILSRTSLSQTFMLDAVLKEPLQRLEIVDYLTDERPFLIMKMHNYSPTEAENRLLKEASLVKEGKDAALFSLPVSILKSSHEIRRREVIQLFDTLGLFRRGKHHVSDSVKRFFEHSFDETFSRQTLRGQGSFLFRSRQWTKLSGDTLKAVLPGQILILNFWVYNYLKDGYVRSQLSIKHRSSSDPRQQQSETADFFRHIIAYQGDWALIEMETETRYPDEILELSVRNTILPEEVFVLDELLIREKGLDIWQSNQKFLLLNGKKYIRR